MIQTPPSPAGHGLTLWTRLVLWFETLMPRLWPALSVLLVFVVLAGFNLFSLMHGWLHLIVLIGLCVAAAALLVRGLWGLTPPAEDSLWRRIERDSALPDRPLQALTDRPADTDPLAAAVFARHQARLRARLGVLQAGWPDPGMARRDPLALRGLLILAALLSAVIAGHNLPERLQAALSPEARLMPLAKLDAWITPPDYTGRAPVQLTALPPGQPTAVPACSILEVRVSGGWGQPVVHIGTGEIAMPPAGPGFSLSQPLQAGGRLAVRQWWRVLGDWPVEITPDSAPQLKLAEKPAATPHAATRLTLEGSDDYGIVAVTGALQGIGKVPDDAPWLKPRPIELPLIAAPVKELKQSFTQDWAADPRAGTTIELTLTARDQSGQQSAPVTSRFTLPEKTFRNKVAAAVIAQRRRLMLSPADRPDVAHELAKIAEDRAAYGNRLVPYLALRAVIGRLLHGRDQATMENAFETLWDTAVYLEDGPGGQALERLRQAQEKLQQAMNDPNTPEAELDRLTEEFRQAMQDYIRQLEREMAERLARGEMVPIIDPDHPGQVLSEDSIDEMVRQLRDMRDSGSRESAQEMLNRMQQMMESLQSGMQGQPGKLDNETQEALRDLDQIRRLEERLRDQVKEPPPSEPDTSDSNQDQGAEGEGQQSEGEQGQSDQSQGEQSEGEQGQSEQSQGEQSEGEQAEGNPGEAAGESADSGDPAGGQNGGEQGAGANAVPGDGELATQQALRKSLGRVMQTLAGKLGDLPKGLGKAELDMRRAEKALKAGDRAAAAAAMDDAVRNLSQGQSQAMQQMGAGTMIGLMPRGMRPPPSEGDDPFGRSFGEPDGNSADWSPFGPKIPSGPDRQRAREILDELRRRAGELERPTPELDYLQRLMKRF